MQAQGNIFSQQQQQQLDQAAAYGKQYAIATKEKKRADHAKHTWWNPFD